MKKTLLFLSMMACIATSHAAPLLSPSLTLPINNDMVGMKQPLKFSWTVKNAKTIKQYRLIISSDERFTNYDLGKGKCTNDNNCAKFDVKTPSKPLPATHPFLQKEGSFFWQVQAISKTNDKSLVFQGTKNTSTGSDMVRKQVIVNQFTVTQKDVDIDDFNVDPSEGANGETFNFSVTLTDELPAGQSVQVDYGDGWKVMQGSGLDYSYAQALSIPTSINDKPVNYQVAIFDENDTSGEPIRRRDGSLTILAAGNSPAPIVDKPEPVKPTPEPVKPVTFTVPSVSTISVSPQSVVQGTALTFSTTLSANLPTGYSVKVDYGNGLFAMTGSGTNYSLTATPVSSAAYSIGVYDAKNTLKSNSQTGNFSVTAPNAAPTLSLISGGISATIGTPYVTQLQASDSNLSLIFIDWGDGASESKNATSGATVSFSHNYTTAGSFVWNATAYDTQDATSSAVSKAVTVAKAPVIDTTVKTTGYTKIANNGSALSDDAKLGTNPTDWACTKDNKTGLIWEVKTDDDGLRDKDKYYNWDGSFTFAADVNAQTLCGANDWRIPTNEELRALVVCSDGKYNTLGKEDNGYICTNYFSVISPTINATYFPNTLSSWFWSSSPNVVSSGYAWVVGFSGGSSFNGNYGYKGNDSNVRLVR
jgi:hypothetical protein